MNCVNWLGAKQFCEWVGGRLPTEKEWQEEATDNGSRRYPWGDDDLTCDRCVRDEGGNGCGNDHTWPECSKTHGNSVSGLCDMAGNVEEWTSSQYPSTEIFASNEETKALKGGVAHRNYRYVILVSYANGLRIIVGPDLYRPDQDRPGTGSGCFGQLPLSKQST